MDQATRLLIGERAAGRCEYCRMPQAALDRSFHVEHIIARQHGGSDDQENLALACDRCNLHKGTNLSSLDPETGETVQLFHPRTQAWEEHFELRGALIIGKSPAGRATARLLDMNAVRRVHLRSALLEAGEF